MVTMLVKQSFTVVAIVALLFASCEGQRMRKRVVSPVIEIGDLGPFRRTNEISLEFDARSSKGGRNLNAIPGSNGGNYMDDNDVKSRVLNFESDKQSNKGNRRSDEWVVDAFRSSENLRMIGVQMSMPSNPSSPSKTPSNPVPAPSPAPTLKPVEATPAPVPTQGSGCESLSREEAMKEALEKLTDASKWDDSSTPQGQAFEWILNDDMAQLDPCNSPTIEQRYALATFYYSTKGDQWDNSRGWITVADECNWIGINCNENGLVNQLGANAALSE